MKKRFTMPPWTNIAVFIPLFPGLLLLWKITLTAPIAGAPEWLGRLSLLIFVVPWTMVLLSLVCPRWIRYERITVAEIEAQPGEPVDAPRPRTIRRFVSQDGRTFSVPSQVLAQIPGQNGSLVGRRLLLGYLKPEEIGFSHEVVRIEAD